MTDEHKKHQPESAPRGGASTRADTPTQGAQDAPLELSQKTWDESVHNQPWNSTTKGRLAIRTFSRGIMGAAFFTTGSLLSRHWMMPEGQTPIFRENGVETPIWHENTHNYIADRPFLQQRNPLQWLAKTIDTFAGKPIEWTATKMFGEEVGRNSVLFKPTKHTRVYRAEALGKTGENIKVCGRSLGEESVILTFDFFMASIGDAIGRDIVGLFDPAVKKKWKDDKGHINYPEAIKSLGKTAWRYVSYNGGEDWAVAIPYVYLIKASRHTLDKVSPGFRFESDVALNKGCLKVNTEAHPHTVSGSFSMEALLDYQFRFTGYNVGTLMFRQLYDKAEQAFHGRSVNLYGTPDKEDPDHSLLHQAHKAVKWGLRSTIIGTTFMTPAVPFFSITRATQDRHLGAFVDPKRNAVLAYTDKGTRRYHIVNTADSKKLLDDIAAGRGDQNKMPGADGKYFYAGFERNGDYEMMHQRGNGNKGYTTLGAKDYRIMLQNHPGHPKAEQYATWAAQEHFTGAQMNPALNPNFDPYGMRLNIAENALSTIGKTASNISRSLDGPARAFDKFRISGKIKGLLGMGKEASFTGFTRPMLNASLSYTPYMFMKAETANLWDNGKTEMAVERMIDGAEQFKWGEFKAGLGEFRDALLHRPFADTAREEEATRRKRIDTSAADTSLEDPAVLERRRQQQKRHAAAVAKVAESKPELSWQERIVKGRDEESQEVVSTKHAPQSHADREAMRKLLENITPPTNSVH